MTLINIHKQKTRPIGRIANTKSNLALSVRKGVVNEARPSFYVTIVKHGSENYFERAQPDFFEERTAREFLPPSNPLSFPRRPSVSPERSGGDQEFFRKWVLVLL